MIRQIGATAPVLTTIQGSLEQQFQADGSYVLTGVQHTARQSNPRSGGGSGFHYHSSFTCIPLDLPFRPARLTPKPVLAGTQTAVVVGPKGAEVCLDKYGRVKVQFHWDRQGKKNENSSCWIRVAQFWAGKGWGAHFWPRIGQEVVVAFEEGDPDQPLIVGSVYNAENPPPYELPEHQTRSGIKTRSTLKGTPANGNEIRFQDKKGAEELYVQAEQQLNVLVKGQEHRIVGGDCRVEVGGKYGLSHWVSDGPYFLHTLGGALIETPGDVAIFAENEESLSAKRKISVCSSDDRVTLAVGTRSPAEATTYLVVQNEPRALALVVEKDKFLTIDQGGIYMTCGGGVIEIDSAGNVNISGTSVNINGSAAAPKSPPSPHGGGGESDASNDEQKELLRRRDALYEARRRLRDAQQHADNLPSP